MYTSYIQSPHETRMYVIEIKLNQTEYLGLNFIITTMK